jgi:Tfp pilus assembly protein PilF
MLTRFGGEASVSARVASASLAIAVAVCSVLLGAKPAPKTSAHEPVTFTRDVAPILFRHCAGCHRPGEVGQFNLLTYDDARQRARQIVYVTERRVMPPWPPDPEFSELKGARTLPLDEVDVLRRWLAEGLQHGDPSDLPRQPTFTVGWQLGRPDLVVGMSETYMTPADGPDVFRNFVLRVPLRARRWVQAMEVRPVNPRVVHHARILLDDTRESRRRDQSDAAPGFEGMDPPGTRFPEGHFLGWAPGRTAMRTSFPWALDPGNDIVVQAHLKPTGRPEPVQLAIGLYFTEQPPTRAPVMLMLGSQTIDIAPGEAQHEVSDSFTLPVDVQALRIYPHAHYLARDMTVVARMPDGSVRGLLRIPDWDLNWQDEYEYATAIDLPRGTTIVMRYVFDNSDGNPRNPRTPPVRVRFGPEASDEMAELLLQLLPKRPEDEPVLRSSVTRAALLASVAGEEKRIADAPNDYRTRNSLGVHYLLLRRINDALTQFAAALAIEPHYATVHYNVGVVALSSQRFDEAIARFHRAVADRPDYVDAHTRLGVALEKAGRPNDAIASFKRAIALNPDYLAAHEGLADLLMRRGTPAEALPSFQHIVRLRPEDPVALDLLASAQAASGNPGLAARTARAAMLLAIKARNDELTRGIQERLERYERQLARW